MAVGSVANSSSFTTTTPSEREIRLTRLFDAPRRLVWDAMTKPEHVRRWYFDNPESIAACEIDFRVGGKWRFAAASAKCSFAFYGVYREIAAPERLVFTEIFEPFPDGESVVTTVLTEENGKTRMTLTATYPSKDVRDTVLATGMEQGAALCYDRLEEVAAELAQGTRDTQTLPRTSPSS